MFVGEREGHVYRPSLLGSMVGKAAAFGIPNDRRRDRHLVDLATLLSIVTPRDDFATVTKRDRHYLVPALREVRARIDELAIDDVDLGLARLEDACAASEIREREARAQRRTEAPKRSRPTRTVCAVRTRYMLGPCVKPLGHDPREGHSSV